MLLVFVAFLCLAMLTQGGHLYSPDEEVMYRVTESLCTRGALDIAPVPDGMGGGFASAAGVDSREYAQYGIGNSLAAVPFYMLGALATRFVSDEAAARALDFETISYAVPERGQPGRGHALLKRLFVSQTGSFIYALTVALIWLLGVMVAARATDERFSARKLMWIGWATALAYGAGTLAWPHARTFFSEPLATFWIIAAFTAALSNTTIGKKRALLCGCFCALALLTRLDSAVVLPAVFMVILLRWISACVGGDRQLATTLAVRIFETFFMRGFGVLLANFLMPIIVFVSWQLIMNAVHFGSPLVSPYVDQSEGIRFSTPLLAGLYGFLFSAGKGIFFFSPCLLLTLFGWRTLWKSFMPACVGFGFAVFCLIVFHSRWQNWAGGWCWGPRHLFMLGALTMPALAAWLVHGRAWRWTIYGCVLFVGICVQLYGSSQSFIDYYILYYRTPDALPQARPLYSLDDTDANSVALERVMPDGSRRPMSLFQLTAPLQDSIYVPQNTQWAAYYKMWAYGYTDNLWLRLMRRSGDIERPVMETK